MIVFWNTFTKITGWLPYYLCFRTKVYYENKKVQSRRIKGPAIIVTNHTSVFDYAVMLFLFWSRTLRYQMAELLFRKTFLRFYLPAMGGIKVDRDALNFNFLTESEDILRRGGVVGIFPESRLPLKTEARPLEFKPSAVFLALAANVPVIPVFTNGSYFSRKRARVMIGTPINPAEYLDPNLTEKENLRNISQLLRERVISLGEQVKQYEEKQK